jgi:predicted acylesterase/phospholipase RssA
MIGASQIGLLLFLVASQIARARLLAQHALALGQLRAWAATIVRLVTLLPLLWWLSLSLGVLSFRHIFQELTTEPPASSRLPTIPPRMAGADGRETAVIVALSGGGSRSALFGTSILTAFDDTSQFKLQSGAVFGDNITYVVGVSGGALAAASHVARKAQARLAGRYEPQSFREAQLRALSQNFELRALAAALVFWPQLTIGSLSNTQMLAAAWAWSGVIRPGDTASLLRDLEAVPRLGIPRLVTVATNAEDGSSVHITTRVIRSRSVLLARLKDAQLGELVAASAAVPFLFAPYSIRVRTRDAERDIYLLDGGLVDNRGLSAVSALMRQLLPAVERPGRGSATQARGPSRKVLVVIVDATGLAPPGPPGSGLQGNIWGGQRALSILMPESESEEEERERLQEEWGRYGSCLALVYIGLPQSARLIPTRWKISSVVSRDLLIDASEMAGLATDIKDFLEWEVGSVSLVGAHAKFGEYLEWKEGAWVMAASDPCGPPPAPSPLETYRAAIEEMMRTVGKVRRVLSHSVTRGDRLAASWHEGTSDSGQRLKFTIDVRQEDNPKDVHANSLIIWCEDVTVRYGPTHRVAKLTLPPEFRATSGDAQYVAAAKLVQMGLRQSALTRDSKEGMLRCQRRVEPEWEPVD